jgi:hypothetical protein
MARLAVLPVEKLSRESPQETNMNTPSTPKSYRLSHEDREAGLSRFHITHGRTLGNSRRLQGWVDVGQEVPGVDEVTTSMSYAMFRRALEAAQEHGCEYVADKMSAAQTVPLVNALEEALGVVKDSALRASILDVIEVCRAGKGLRAV